MSQRASTTAACPGEKICCFCGWKDDNELDYGKFYEHDGIITHYYCLLFSSNMQQKGLDEEGILGFLPEDIHKELKRGKRLCCSYCKKQGATLGCCNVKCKKVFHLPCGLKAGTLHQYFGEFRSYCINHRPKQKIDPAVLKEIARVETKICYICYDEVNPRDFMGTIWAPCCKKNAWFHRLCVQQLAMSAGYFFKCPLCNNKNEFQKAMLDHGIFIPSQDASWELVPNAFQELLYRHNRCDAEKCVCPKGREHTSSNAKWELTLCRTCGSQGIHMACGHLKWGQSLWECVECTSILSRSSISNKYQNSNSELSTEEDSGSDSDSDISVGAYNESSVKSVGSSDSNENPQSSNIQETEKSSESEPEDVDDSSKMVESRLQNTEVKEDEQISDDFSPLMKRQKISYPTGDDVIVDSDDDIIFVSTQNRSESEHQNTNSRTLRSTNNNKVVDEGAKSQNVSSTSMLASLESQQQTNAKVPNGEKGDPIEIDLSDSESITTIIPEDTDVTSNAAPLIPEMNIQITNVTSLAPEVFDVPEDEDPLGETVSNNHVNYASSTTNHSSNTEVYEKLQIVRLDHNANGEKNGPMYGLRIPGTTRTVPLVIPSSSCQDPLEESGANIGSQSKDTNDDPLIDFVKVSGPKSYKAALLSAAIEKNANIRNELPGTTEPQSTISTIEPMIESNESYCLLEIDAAGQQINNEDAKNNEKVADPELSYAIPLEMVVNDQILQSQSKTGKRSKKKRHSRSSEQSESSRSVANNSEGISTNVKATTASKTLIAADLDYNLSSKTPPIGQQVPVNTIPSLQAQVTDNSIASAVSQTLHPLDQVSTNVSTVPQNGYSSIVGLITPWPANGITGIYQNSNLASVPKFGTLPSQFSTMGGNFQSPTNQAVLPLNCHGDAGSSPADGPKCCNRTSSGMEGVSATETSSCTGPRDAESIRHSIRTIAKEHGSEKPTRLFDEKYDTTECPVAVNRANSTDRIGLMNEIISLRDLKFKVNGLNVIEMTLYDSYCVHINVRNGKKRKYKSEENSNILKMDKSDSFCKRKIRTLSSQSSEGSICVNNDSVLPSSLTNTFTLSMDTESNDMLDVSANTQDGVTKTDSETTINIFPPSEVNSRVQDEVKENLDPVTPSTNQTSSPSLLERRNKTRRDGIKDTMQLLNEMENQEKTSIEKSNPSKTLSSTWSENCSMTQTISGSDTNEKLTANPGNGNTVKRTRMHSDSIVCNETAETSNHGKLVKRSKYRRRENVGESQVEQTISENSKSDHVTSINCLVSNVERIHNRRSARLNVERSDENINTDNVMNNQQTNQRRGPNGGFSGCCKVSIDLAKIRLALNSKLKSSNNEIKNEKCYGCASPLRQVNQKTNENNSSAKTFHGIRRTRSFENLKSKDFSSEKKLPCFKLRKWKSSEDLRRSLQKYSEVGKDLHGKLRQSCSPFLRALPSEGLYEDLPSTDFASVLRRSSEVCRNLRSRLRKSTESYFQALPSDALLYEDRSSSEVFSSKLRRSSEVCRDIRSRLRKSTERSDYNARLENGKCA